jgi:hypothetical protein
MGCAGIQNFNYWVFLNKKIPGVFFLVQFLDHFGKGKSSTLEKFFLFQSVLKNRYFDTLEKESFSYKFPFPIVSKSGY